MSCKTITIHVCDRCGKQSSSRDGWGEVFIMEDERSLNSVDNNEDVCAECLSDAMNWWSAPKQVRQMHWRVA